MTAALLLAAITAIILVPVAIGIGVAASRRQHAEPAPLPGGGDTVVTPTTVAWARRRDYRAEGDAVEDQARPQRSPILSPVTGAPLEDFAPGQYLTFALDPPASLTRPTRTVVRCCSMSHKPNAANFRITVKRMPAPSTRPDLPAGAASSFLHDAVRVGDVLRVKAPAGQFVLDNASDVPVVFLAGGIGVTPMISMIAWSLTRQPDRRLHLFDGVRNGADRAFKTRLEGFAPSHPTFTLTSFTLRPTLMMSRAARARGIGRSGRPWPQGTAA
jgi:ferredoxin-NADP reductase